MLVGTLFEGVVFQEWLDEVSEEHRNILFDPDIASVAHTSFDWVQLGRRSLLVQGTLLDTRVAAAVLNENQDLDLRSLCRKYVGIELDKEIRKHLDALPHDEVLAYNRGDLLATEALFNDLHQKIHDTGWQSYWLEEEVPFTRVLVDAMIAGMPVDEAAAARLKEELEMEETMRLGKLYQDAGLPSDVVNLRSGDQLAAYLFSRRFFVPGRIPVESLTEEELARLREETPN